MDWKNYTASQPSVLVLIRVQMPYLSSNFPLTLEYYIIVLCFVIILEVQNVEDEVKEQIQSLLQEQEHTEYGMNSILFQILFHTVMKIVEFL